MFVLSVINAGSCCSPQCCDEYPRFAAADRHIASPWPCGDGVGVGLRELRFCSGHVVASPSSEFAWWNRSSCCSMSAANFCGSFKCLNSRIA